MKTTDGQSFDKLLERSLPAIESKKEELLSLGYEDVTVQTILDCLKTHVWKKEKPTKIYEIVADILSLNPSVYMNFISNSALTMDEDLMASISAVTREENE